MTSYSRPIFNQTPPDKPSESKYAQHMLKTSSDRKMPLRPTNLGIRTIRKRKGCRRFDMRCLLPKLQQKYIEAIHVNKRNIEAMATQETEGKHSYSCIN